MKSIKKSVKRITAFVLAVLLATGILPEHDLLQAEAAQLPTFEVSFESEAAVGATVTLTNTNDAEDTASAEVKKNITTEEGTEEISRKATFTDFVDDTKTYTLMVSGIIGYETYTTTINEGTSSCTVSTGDMTALNERNITGIVNDSAGNPISGATVAYTAYDGRVTGTVSTDGAGAYSITVYDGIPYTIMISGDECYLPATAFEETAAGEDKDHGETILERSTYQITVNYNENGTVVVTDDLPETEDTGVTSGGKVTVEPGKDVKLKAAADEGHHVESVVVDGNDIINDAFGKNETIEYTYHLENVTEDHEMTFRFAKNTYRMTTSVKDGIGGTITASGTTVEYGGEVTFTLSPQEGYRIAGIKKNGVTVGYDPTAMQEKDDGSMTYQAANVTEDIHVEVEFSTYTVSDVILEKSVSFEVEEGKTIKMTEDDSGHYIYTNADAITIKAVDSNYGIKFSTFSRWYSTIKKTKNETLHKIYVVNKNNWFDAEQMNSKPVYLIFDTTAPVWKEDSQTTSGPEEIWTAGTEVRYTGTVENAPADEQKSALSHVAWFSEEKTAAEVLAETVHKTTITEQDGTGTFTIPLDLGGAEEAAYYLYAADDAGNVSTAKQVVVKKDSTAPEIIKVEYKKEDGSQQSKAIYFADYGSYFMEPLQIAITILDANATSGIRQVVLYNEKGEAVFTISGKSIEQDGTNTYVATMVIPASEFQLSGMTIQATDRVGWESPLAQPKDTNSLILSNDLVISREAARVEIRAQKAAGYTKKVDGKIQDWYPGEVGFTVDAGTKNAKLGINRILADINDVRVKEMSYTAALTADATIDSGITARAYGRNTITATAITNAQVESTATETVYIDTISPTVTDFQFQSKKSGLLSILTFGNFGKDVVEITVTAVDGLDKDGKELSDYSGVKSITLYGDGKALKTAEADAQGKAVFTIPASEILNNEKMFDQTISAIAEDQVGNRTKEAVMPDDRNSNVADSGLMIETTAPKISIKTTGIVYRDSKKQDWCDQDIDYTITVKDGDSGIRSVEVSINGKEIVKNKAEGSAINTKFYEKAEKTKTASFVIGTEQGKAEEDGSYEIKVVVTDNAGNTKTTTKKVYKDEEAPYITGFAFAGDGNSRADGSKVNVTETEYGYYFKESVKVTITARDIEPATGPAYITYYLVSEDGSKGREVKKAVDKENRITVTIPADFKGQIYARPTDAAGNCAADFVTPKGTIVESKAQHEKTSSITYTMPKTPYEDGAGNPLYKADTEIRVSVEDQYSGIASIDWKIEAAYDDKKQAGTILVDNEGTVTSQAEEGYQADCLGSFAVTKESNLVTRLGTTITVSNECNDIRLVLTLTDQAGNKTEQVAQILSIDRTASEIAVTMDQNEDRENGIFKEDRQASIVIHERNFRNENVVVQVVRTDENGVQMQENVAADFVPTVENGAPKIFVNVDGTVYQEYTMNYVFTKDGDYQISVSATDAAANGNQPVVYSNPTVDTAFTIDKTAPVIRVSYDNNDAANGRYFKEARVATLTVTEHNFDPERITYTRSAMRSGEPIELPAVSEWSSNGNVHTATITYDVDGDYTFEIAMEDMAGNIAAAADYEGAVAEGDFTIDTTMERPVITGVENGKAYPDKVVPVIRFEDINYADHEIRLLRTRKGEIDQDVTEQFIQDLTTTTSGGSGSNDTFDRIPENDGIYQLSVKVTDKAGNEATEQVVFTVNRFGSVYAFDGYLVSVQDAYLQKIEKDLVITEYNPNRLLEGSVQILITHDGDPLEEVAYTVDTAVNAYTQVGESGWYQYEYTIDRSNFTKDGIYKLTIASEDEAGNMPETLNYEECDAVFRVDTTPAEITNVTGLENARVDAESQKVAFEVFDAIGLKKILVYVNDEVIGEFEELDNIISYSNSVELKEGSSQKVRIVVEDLAGNITDTDSSDFAPAFAFQKEITITTNALILWYADKPLFWGSILAGLAVINGGIVSAAAIRRRKKKQNRIEKV